MVGDTVLLQCTTYRGKHKIQDQWEDTVFANLTKLNFMQFNIKLKSKRKLDQEVKQQGRNNVYRKKQR